MVNTNSKSDYNLGHAKFIGIGTVVILVGMAGWSWSFHPIKIL